MRRAQIYAIRNLLDAKVYVGSTVNLKNRWKCHKTGLRSGCHHSKHLQGAWNKYGESSFTVEVLDECPATVRKVVEQFWIDHFNSANQEFGYNMCPNAESIVGRVHSEETKRKISIAHKGKIRSKTHCENLSKSQIGRKLSDEWKANVSAALKGKRRTPEQIAKSVAARRPFKLSDSAKQKIREAATGRKVSQETRKKLSIAGTGRKWSASQREKMSKVVWPAHSPESRARLSEARGGRPFTLISPEGKRFNLSTLRDVLAFGLDQSNVHKVLKGKARQTKGYRAEYAPEGVGER